MPSSARIRGWDFVDGYTHAYSLAELLELLHDTDPAECLRLCRPSLRRKGGR